MGMFKIRFSYGKVGNDNIRHDNADARFLIYIQLEMVVIMIGPTMVVLMALQA